MHEVQSVGDGRAGLVQDHLVSELERELEGEARRTKLIPGNTLDDGSVDAFLATPVNTFLSIAPDIS